MTRKSFRLQESPLHMLRRIHRRIDFADLRARKMTPRQIGVLAAVGEEEKQTQRDIAKKVGIDTSTLSVLIASLQEKGLLGQVRSRSDRRASVLRLTAKGKKVLEQALPMLQQADRQFLSCLSASERKSFLGLLNRVVDGLEAMEIPRRHIPPRLPPR